MSKKSATAMVFGVFDGLHDGHRYFLAAARGHGDELIAVVARDSMVQMLKHKTSVQNEDERLGGLAAITEVSHAELGDSEIGSYAIVRKHEPDVICLGYDQHALADDLAARMAAGEIPEVRLVQLQAHEPEQWHTSLLEKRLSESPVL